ncbi:MAG: LysE family transporter [Candidatus Euphemobacter frigidus]|nr:LysE family transporter [Candidatus Euphemobacter frigidus]MDP8276502.1 LysE family transporter [Candidatus Euphemobacter frigidus]
MFHIFGLAFILALTGAIAPGPVLVLVIGQVLARGISAAFFIMLGHALLESLLILGLARGMKNLIADRRVRSVLGMVGGLVLLWMGWDLFHQPGVMKLSGNGVEAISGVKLVLAGIGVSLSNPYFTGWWATVGTGQVASLKLKSVWDYSIFFIGHELGDLAWYLFVAVMVAAGRGWLEGENYRIVMKVSAVIILLFGGAFLILSIGLLIKRKVNVKT